MNFTIVKTLDLGELGEQEFVFEVSYTPGRPGTMYSRNGDPGDPPESPEIDIRSAKLGQHDASFLFDGDFEDLYDELLEDADELYHERPEE